MKIFSKKKVAQNKYRITFTNAYLKRMLEVHPTVCSIIFKLIEQAFKNYKGASIFVVPEQEDVLNKHVTYFNNSKSSIEQMNLEKCFIAGCLNGLIHVELEEAPEKLNEYFKIIYNW